MPVIDYRKMVRKRAGDALDPAEQVLCAFLVKPKGTLRKAVLDSTFDKILGIAIPIGGAVGGAISGAIQGTVAGVADALHGPPPPVLAARFPSGEDVIVAVTTARYVVFRQKFGLAAPRLVLGAVYLPAEVAQLGLKGGVAMRKLLLVFADQSAVQMDLPRGQGDVNELTAALGRLQAITGDR